jgi:MEMO1 family protein
MTLDFQPSPVEDRPGLLIRDPYRFSDAVMIIPPGLVECLQFFDGEQSELDLRQALVQLTGQFDVSDIEQHLQETLSEAGFLEDDRFAEMRATRMAEFAELPTRAPAHAGTGYPDDPEELREVMGEFMKPDGEAPAPEGKLYGIAAPHVSPVGGWQSYRAAYRMMGPELKDRTFVVLGTSHYGEPERFGLTRKPYVTPWGEARTDRELVDRLEREGGAAVSMEDYCHSFEHTIEFQVVYLQHLYGPDVKILPVLCGSYAESLYGGGGKPESEESVRRFLGALGEMAEREGDRLFWVLGIDMAHMGARYGDRFTATADRGEMADVGDKDRRRIERINAGDADGFWDLVQQDQDPLKWCGSAPLYTFLKGAPRGRGELFRYEQWNIDEQSVVSFAGMGFYK